MPTLHGSWIWVDMSPFTSAANANVYVIKPVPVAGTIKEVRMSMVEALATGGGIMTLHKNTVNILSSASLNLEADFASLTAESEVLTTNAASLKVTTADSLKALFTLTTFAITNAIGCLVAIEPDVW